jgi:hypothetical protein
MRDSPANIETKGIAFIATSTLSIIPLFTPTTVSKPTKETGEQNRTTAA